MDDKVSEKNSDGYKDLESRCCQSGCPGCPWGFVADPETPGELINQELAEKAEIDWQEIAEKYLSENEASSPENEGLSK